MNAEQLLQHFERISEAPDAIPRLRRFVLDLAVRGKLVEQDPRDEPATEMLKRIAAEKARLAKAGEIKKEKPLAPVEKADFDVPKSWTWSRLGKVTSYIQRGKSPKYAVNDGSLVVSQKCVQWRGLDLTVAKRITLESLVDYETIRFLCDGDLLWNSTGTGTIGRIIRVVDPPEKLVCDSHVTVVRCLAVVPEYIRAWLRSDQVYALIEDRAAGSTNQVELTAQMAINQIVPLPPLAEQHRIVARVDELMKLCDQLEAAKTVREKCRDSLVAASLQGLNQPSDEEEAFREHARFTFNNLPRITTRAAHIKQLRQTILNLAVRGKLVPQDPSDEPAAELLKRIAAEKARLVKERKIKCPPTVESVDTTNVPFILPENWAWALMGEVYDVRDGTHDSPRYQADGYPLITSKDFVDGKISFDNCKFISKEDHDKISQRSKVDAGDILFSMIGGNIGNMVHVDVDREFSIKNVALFKYFSLDLSLPSFLKVVLMNLSGNVQQKAIGGAQPFVSLGFLRGALIGLPSLAEQHRIVAKVDELMAICDQLEGQINVVEQDSRHFLEAVLNEALSPALAEAA